KDVANTNLFQYKSNLIAVGCVPGVTRLVLEAEVDQLYYLKVRALIDPLQSHFWDIVTTTNQHPNKEKSEALKTERSELLTKLWSNIPDPAVHNLGTYEGLVSDESLTKLKKIDEDYESRIRGLNDKLEHVKEPHTVNGEAERTKLVAEINRLSVEKEERFRSAITPSESRELELRNSLFAQKMAGMVDFDASPEELIKMAELSVEARKRALEMNAARSDAERKTDQDAFVQKQFDAAFQQALGAEFGQSRLDEYKLASDSEYQSFAQWSRAAQFPPGMALQLFNEKRQALLVADQVRNSAMAPNEKEAALQEVRDALQSQLQTHMNPEAYSAFRKENKDWIQSLK
ncbi:MAG: hypothetical protein JWM04_1546, partial [Verrucomicrobiales bacterium]|nr:hypothetical protein [Verrucomicrobiales bacterium]